MCRMIMDISNSLKMVIINFTLCSQHCFISIQQIIKIFRFLFNRFFLFSCLRNMIRWILLTYSRLSMSYVKLVCIEYFRAQLTTFKSTKIRIIQYIQTSFNLDENINDSVKNKTAQYIIFISRYNVTKCEHCRNLRIRMSNKTQNTLTNTQYIVSPHA